MKLYRASDTLAGWIAASSAVGLFALAALPFLDLKQWYAWVTLGVAPLSILLLASRTKSWLQTEPLPVPADAQLSPGRKTWLLSLAYTLLTTGFGSAIILGDLIDPSNNTTIFPAGLIAVLFAVCAGSGVILGLVSLQIVRHLEQGWGGTLYAEGQWVGNDRYLIGAATATDIGLAQSASAHQRNDTLDTA